MPATFGQCKLAVSNSIDLTGNQPPVEKMEFPHTLDPPATFGLSAFRHAGCVRRIQARQLSYDRSDRRAQGAASSDGATVSAPRSDRSLAIRQLKAGALRANQLAPGGHP